MTNADINAIFDQLDRDRHLAGYRLEERASPFFKPFLQIEKDAAIARPFPKLL